MTTVRRFGAVFVAAAVVALLPVTAGQAAPGLLDTAFGVNGVATVPTAPLQGWATAIARQADGKLVAAGNRGADPSGLNADTGAALVVRLQYNGQPDPTFATNGVFVFDGTGREWPTAVAIQGDGKIVVAYSVLVQGVGAHVDLLRLTAAGALDPTFGSGGTVAGPSGFIVNTAVSGMALQPDGKILVTYGTPNTGTVDEKVDVVVRRYNVDGGLDPSFGSGGTATADFSAFAGPSSDWGTAVAVAPGGRVVVGAWTVPQAGAGGMTGFALAGFTPAGALDAGFGAGGLVLTQFPGKQAKLNDLAMAPDGSFYAAGEVLDSPKPIAVVHYTAEGALDPAFGGNGIVQTAPPGGSAYRAEASALAFDSYGGVVVAGFQYQQPPLGSNISRGDMFVLRLQPWGTPVPSFGGTGAVTALTSGLSQPFGVAVDPTGGIYVAGQIDGRFAVVKHRAGTAVRGMGWNVVGQLGNGTVDDAVLPVSAPALRGAEAVAAGAYHGVAVKGDGTAWAWGWNGVGQLGDGTTTDHAAPVQVANAATFTSVSAGAYHSLGLTRDGNVLAWGWNAVGTLGDGTTVDRHTPVQVASGMVAVSAGTFHSLALKADGTVWAWGWNGAGQLGDGTTTDRWSPVQVAGLTNVVAIAGGGYHSLALKADGTVWAWGWNAVGQLGDGTTVDRHTPVQVMGVSGATQIAAGAHHGFAIVAGGALKAWGWNAVGQLGDGTNVNRASAVTVPGLSGVARIAGGAYHSLATGADGSVWAWGWNGVGQLGTGGRADRWVPTAVDAWAPVAIAAGLAQSLLVGQNPLDL